MRDFLKSIGGLAIGIGIFLGIIFLAMFLIKGGVWLGVTVLPWLSIIMWIVLVLDLLIILPFGAFKKTKGIASIGLVISSYVYGLTLWLWALLLAYMIWGAVAVFIGLFLAGVGVVPVAMLATIFKGEWSIFGQLAFLTVLTYGSRVLGYHFAKRADEIAYEAAISSTTHNMTIQERTTQLQKVPPQEPTIENNTISNEKALLESLRNEGVLTTDEFTQKMAILEANEEETKFEKLLQAQTGPLIGKIFKLKATGLLDEQECEQKKCAITKKYSDELRAILMDDYRAMNMASFDYADILDKKIKFGVLKTEEQEICELTRLQEKQQEPENSMTDTDKNIRAMVLEKQKGLLFI